jgi:hypothetical protein
MSAPDVAELYARRPPINSEEYGQWAFWDVWDDILAVSPPNKADRERPNLTADDMVGWARLGFDAVKVRRDLKIGEKRP